MEIASGYAANTPHKIQVLQNGVKIGESLAATVSTVGSATLLTAVITLDPVSAGLIYVSSYDSLGVLTNQERFTVDSDGVIQDGDVAAVLAKGNIDGYTLEEAQRIILAALAGAVSGGGTTTNTIAAADGSKTRISATVDTSGNRSSLTLDAT